MGRKAPHPFLGGWVALSKLHQLTASKLPSWELVGWWRDHCLVLLAGREGLSGNPEPACGPPSEAPTSPRQEWEGLGPWSLPQGQLYGCAEGSRDSQQRWGVTVAVCVGGEGVAGSAPVPPPPRASASSAATWTVWEERGTVTALLGAWQMGPQMLLLPAPREEHSPALHRRLSPFLGITRYFYSFAAKVTQGCLLVLPQVPPLRREVGLRTDGSSQLFLEEPRKKPSVFPLVSLPTQSQLSHYTHLPGSSLSAGLRPT